MKHVHILDLAMGNLRSVQKALEAVGAKAVIAKEASEVARADRLVLPGVGAFGDAMAALRQDGLAEAVVGHALSGRPLLGICLGLQVLFEVGWEGGRHEGLGILAGEVRPFPLDLAEGSRRLKVPHMGWNTVRATPEGGRLLGDAGVEPYFYFVHSYYAEPADRSLVAGTTTYGVEFASAVVRDSVMATQFHPEKSQRVGLSILARFLEV